jgi:hypothetical protein
VAGVDDEWALDIERGTRSCISNDVAVLLMWTKTAKRPNIMSGDAHSTSELRQSPFAWQPRGTTARSVWACA